jgi:hypothetical protein
MLMAMLMGLAGCPTEDKAASSPIKVLQPKDGARYRMTDTVRIITETDFTRVAGNLSAIFSTDSGKVWRLVLSAPHHDGLARDTFPFPLADHGDTIRAGSEVKLRMKEYGATGIHEDIGYIHIE